MDEVREEMNIDPQYILAGWVSQPRMSIIHEESYLLAFLHLNERSPATARPPPPYVCDFESAILAHGSQDFLRQ